jgi:exodeoxyribonuclease VII small subunit
MPRWMEVKDVTEELQNLSFEAALKELEELVARLEAGDLTLEESLALFERGQKLTDYCNSLLDQASLRVEQLTEDGEIIDLTAP